jgi:hypothetical protein
MQGHDSATGHAVGFSLYNLDFDNDGVADTFDLLQFLYGGRDGTAEVTKLINQSPREWFDILPGDGAK